MVFSSIRVFSRCSSKMPTTAARLGYIYPAAPTLHSISIALEMLSFPNFQLSGMLFHFHQESLQILNCGVNTSPGGFPEVPMMEQDSILGASNDTGTLLS
jgi:hypothetical protein